MKNLKEWQKSVISAVAIVAAFLLLAFIASYETPAQIKKREAVSRELETTEKLRRELERLELQRKIREELNR